MARRYYTSKKRGYRARRDALAESFPAAHDFLRGLEVLCEGEHGFHMGTARHVQCYFGEGFLFHLAIFDADTPEPRLELSPRHHGRLKEGTHSAAHALFRERIHRVVEELRLPGRALLRKEDVYHIGRQTPLVFFRLLQGELLDIVARGTAAPAQRELFAGRDKRRRRRRRKRRPGGAAALVERAGAAEAALGALVGDLRAHLGADLDLELGPDGATVTIPGQEGGEGATHRAESLAEAVAAALHARVGAEVGGGEGEGGGAAGA